MSPIERGGGGGGGGTTSPLTTKGDVYTFSTVNARLPVGSDTQVLTANSAATTGNDWEYPPGHEFDYVQRTTNYSNAGTSYTTVLDGNAVTYDGSTRIKLEFNAPVFELSTSMTANIELFDGATDLCEMSGLTSSGGLTDGPLYAAIFITPSAGAHTYHLKAARGITAGTITIAAGVGTGAAFMPAWYRITKA